MSFSFKLNWKAYLKIVLLQLVIIILLFQQISNSLFIFIFDTYSFIPSNFIIIASFITLSVLYAPICLLHELLHAFTHKILGGKPRIGFKGLYAYTVETSGKEYSRSELLIVLLMPVTVISLVYMILPLDIFKMAYYLNLLGSCGDLYMSFWLCRVDSNMRIVDKSYGFDVISHHI